ncbi:MAG: DUF29 domain-containing protein [Candidatus Accumulibacter phosphatis]|uniref:DUF29 domain-containing protein n=2 Tax=Candidatus Accumulibacter TaxID=327159 RepID=A0A7D5NDW9_9PROT|nr:MULTISPECIES: DUF29 domain-containing protein [Candidatus Accumulibacter]QLH50509.1 MAG: DUF29 domain-containing protein [Candidatus Accumulibacter cognatus]MBL8399880.1 DUF29 domain-containing protein [Accumulibacter sp.]MBN8516557.1 DUF29 domain-containing protein [Accumulibacter sp.]MCC2867825.1 DUF29 domain-containing protein [Candidatus Accumulibacter phosphatis]MCM8580813.1 DUF29 domain-containing protein [Accumulibacter sp.]
MQATLYQSDFYTWARQQADLLREGRFDTLDAEHLIEELEAMGSRERRELANRLTVLLTHLLKWQFQPSRQGASWTLTIRVQRMDIADLLNDEPGLIPEIPQAFEKAYRKARLLAANETGMDEATFPKQSPYTIEQTMADDYLPEGN